MNRAKPPKTQAAVDELENLFKALADKSRLRILALLGNNEVCVCHIHDSLGLPQPTVSRHLAVSAEERSRRSTPRRCVDALSCAFLS
jgi:ArsR family transcriptional regulator, arsenate/arsenite/antimonite-responsive transcriptional repressor